MKGSVQQSAIQSNTEFRFQQDSNPEPPDPKLGVLTTQPPGPSYSKHHSLNELICGQTINRSGKNNI